MPSNLRKQTKRQAKSPPAVARMERWKLEDAKARLSEVVRLAGTNGPQLVTIRGKEAAVILAPEEYRRLLPERKGRVPLVRFLQNLGLSELPLEREIDTGRDVDL
jgi:prevent-host-death family protein